VAALGVFLTAYGFNHSHLYWKVAGFALLGLAVVLLVVMLFLRKRIALTSALFTECCHGIEHNPALFLVALITIAVFAAFTVYWVSAFVYLFSIRDNTVQLEPDLPPKFDQKVRNLMFFQVFGFFWTSALISAVFQMSIAGGIATWYFSRTAHYQPAPISPTITSFGRALSKSFGSLAFGALIMAVVKFINFLLSYSKKTNRTNRLLVCLISCVQCLFSCVERFVKFVNRFAFIYIAMHGDNFCTAAKGCYDVISKNLFTAVVVDLLGDFVLFVGKLLGTAVCTLFTVGALTAMGRPFGAVTIVLVAVVSYLVFNLYAHIVDVGVDTVFVCYMEDLEHNKDGNLFMDPSVHQMLQERAKQAKEQQVSSNN